MTKCDMFGTSKYVLGLPIAVVQQQYSINSSTRRVLAALTTQKKMRLSLLEGK